jgi:glutaminyl-tRNA synthetase
MSTHPDNTNAPTSDKRITPNFITEIIQADVQQGRVVRVGTRFPPEPNGYAHVGHTFACLLNYGLAQDFGGRFVLRMDDTNPETERQEYADAIQRDLNWLGVDWRKNLSYASDYFPQLHDFAVQLIQKGLAYVDSVPSDEMARSRGTVDTAGTPSPYRSRSVTENLELFDRMRAGEFPRGAHVLRAKIDLANPNMKLRDPVLYRIVHASHYRTGDTWCIYPSYDFAQALTDALDGVTHSLCSLEFIDNNAIYKWLIEHLWSESVAPRQFEFGRRSLEYTVVSKRKLLRLVNEHHVNGWDDPRMPTISGFRRRGVTPEALRAFASGISVTRTNRTVDIAVLENAIRDDLNVRSPRVMAVLKPLRVVIENAKDTMLNLPYWPQDVVKLAQSGHVKLPEDRSETATRAVPFTPEIFIEREDFEVEPPKGFKRLTLHGKVRLRGAGVIECQSFETDDAGNVTLLRCKMLPDTEKAPGVIHWVSSSKSVKFEARLYDRLFRVPQPEAEAKELEDENDPDDTTDFLSFLNPSSLEIVTGFLEPSVLHDPVDTRYQFERLGYFWRDPVDLSGEKIVMNRIIALSDSWTGKIEIKGTATATVGISANSNATIEIKGTATATVGISASSSATIEVKGTATAVVMTPEQAEIAERYVKSGVTESESLVLAKEPKLVVYLEEAVQHGDIAALSSWVVNDLGTPLREGDVKVSPAELAALVKLVQDGALSRNQAKTVLEKALLTGDNPAVIVEREGLKQVSDAGTLELAVDGVIAANPQKLEEYRAGRKGLLGFFVGQVMQATKGQGNPQLVQEIVKRKLEL